MSITRVQGNQVNSTTTVTSQAVTLPSGVTLGNLLIAAVACGSNNTTITGPSGWTQVIINQPAGSSATIETSIWYLVVDANHAGGTSWTWTLSASHTMYLCIEEWSASAGWPANPVDVSASGDTVPTPVQATTIDSGTTATTSQAEELWVASLAYKGSAQTESSITTGWTKDLEATLASNNTMTLLYKVASSTGTVDCSYVIGTAAYWAGCAVAFKDNTGIALSVTMAGAGTLSGTLSVSAVALSVTMAGRGTLAGTISAPIFFSVTMAGRGTLFGILPGDIMVFIGGAWVFVEAGTLTINNTIGRRSQASFTAFTTIRVPFPQYSQVQIYDPTGTLIFSGYVIDAPAHKPGFQPYLIHEITCIDQHYLADKRVIDQLYRNKTCGFIVNDIITNILSAEGVSVGMIATGATVPVANFGYCSCSDALDALVAAASASGTPYYWMIDQNKAMWFVPYTAIPGPTVDGTTIDEGERSGVKPTVKPGNLKYRNTQYAVGGFNQTASQDETRQGDGQTRSFTYSYPLAGAPSTFTLNGAAKTLGTKGQTGYQYYWAAGDPTITQDSSQTILVSTDRLRMVYTGEFSTVYSAQNAAQVTAQANIDGTSGINEAVLEDKSIVDASDGNAKVNQQLTQYGIPGLRFQFATLDTSFAPGQLITVNYAPYGFSASQQLVEEVDISDQFDGFNLWNTVNTVVGPYDTTWVEFFGNLFKPATIANSISLGVTLNTPLFPSTTLQPSTTLFPS